MSKLDIRNNIKLTALLNYYRQESLKSRNPIQPGDP